MKPVLSILICTIPSRKKMFDKLLFSIAEQLIDIPNSEELVEVLYDETPAKEMTIGEKRNILIEQSTGQYTCFVDDDDQIAKNYLSSMLKACKENKDCVELRLQVLAKNHLSNVIFHYHLSHGTEPKKLQEDVYIFPIGHLNPIRSSITKRFKFPHKNVGEDLEWSRSLSSELKTMAETEETLYFYNKMSK